jgi:hypothetical protein
VHGPGERGHGASSAATGQSRDDANILALLSRDSDTSLGGEVLLMLGEVCGGVIFRLDPHVMALSQPCLARRRDASEVGPKASFLAFTTLSHSDHTIITASKKPCATKAAHAAVSPTYMHMSSEFRRCKRRCILCSSRLDPASPSVSSTLFSRVSDCDLSSYDSTSSIASFVFRDL